MVTTCPKCHHKRTAADYGVPDWQCPGCGIAYAKYVDGAPPPAPRTLESSQASSGWIVPVAGVLLLTSVAAFGYYAYHSHIKPRPMPVEVSEARAPSTFVEGPRLEASNPAFYGTMESGAPVLRMTPETAAGLSKTASSARVVMFATSWCPYCAKARELFKKKGVRFTELDIERNPQAKDFMERVMGMSGYPTIVIGNRVTLGFNEPQIEASLKEL
jgi:glutaredoxin